MSITFDDLDGELYPKPDPFLTDLVGWAKEKLEAHLWSKQVEIAEALRDHRKVAVKACHGPGKSFTAGLLVSHWIDTHPVGQASAVTSAPTDHQVKAILWKEIARAHRKGGLDGYVTLDAQWKIGAELVAFGRKPADHDEHGFQGIHERYLLVVLDEACGIPPALWTGAGTLGTNDDARMLAIGNPDDPSSEFATICTGAPDDGTSGLSDEGWWVITISIFDTPNFTGEWVPSELRLQLPSQTWLDDQTKKWGVGSPLYTSKVLGRFPADASTGTVPWSWIKACQGDTIDVGPLRVPVELGADIAGSDAGDVTVVYERQGMRAGRQWSVQSSDPEIVLQLIEDAVRESGATRLKIDGIGVGWGLVAPLRRTFPKLDVVPVVVSEAAPGEDPEDRKPMAEKFVNLRAYLWWQVGRVLSQEHRWDLTDVADETLNELAAPKYREVKGRIQIESKDDLRKRISRSTDHADALLLAFYDPPAATPEGTTTDYVNQALGGSR